MLEQAEKGLELEYLENGSPIITGKKKVGRGSRLREADFEKRH